MENQVYNWFVKNGNILIQKNEDCISLQIVYQNGDCCLLTHSDANELIELLTKISIQIWEDPKYEKKAYLDQLYKKLDDKYYWKIDTSELIIKYNEIEDAIEIKYFGNRRYNLEINYVIEIIQILEYLNK
ncbi:hypothetical protein [Flavobacterium johnsoniae]|uniref:Uncharacterized protein n=1 Tax=Flavobacterium johnsoniae TaxID=986 RepID=A0A1M5W4S6_FLAJO|nr:hypothetical protein [Flavobacterium johnsoniae]SHH82460.1 hypothetical protein SAMN05444388_12328 [Flavobacterium johnsoniae]